MNWLTLSKTSDAAADILESGQDIAYSWDYPNAPHLLSIEFKNTKEQHTYQLDVIEAFKPITVSVLFIASKFDVYLITTFRTRLCIRMCMQMDLQEFLPSLKTKLSSLKKHSVKMEDR